MRLSIPLLFCSALLIGCGKEDTPAAKKNDAPEVVTVSLAPTRIAPVERTVEVVGTLYGDEEATISAKVAGRVTEIFRDVGDRASDGDPLAQIEKTDYELYVTQAKMAIAQPLAKLGLTEVPPADFDASKVSTVIQKKLEAANAEARFRRAEKLFAAKPPLISEQDYSDQKTAYEVASSAYDVAILEAKALVAEARARQSELRLAEQRLADTTVRAPVIAGTTQPAGRFGVAQRLVSVGEYVREGTAMFRLVADNPIKYRASVPEKYAQQVKVGQRADITVEAYREPFEGVVTRVNPQVDQATRSFQVEVRVPNDKGLLRPGSFARGSIRTSTEPDVTFVPASSVISFAGISKIFTVKDGKAVEAHVTLGAKRGDWVEIVSGLKGQQQVVVDGAAKLANGIPVKIEQRQATESTTRPAVADSK